METVSRWYNIMTIFYTIHPMASNFIILLIVILGSTLKLAEACRRFLLNPVKDVSVQRWAIEGLSYLTLDAEVKEKLIEVTYIPSILL